MAFTYPLALSVLNDKLRIQRVRWDVQRNDEFSGLGDGRIYAAELAPPLWIADVTLIPMMIGEAKEIAAIIRKLHGSMNGFYLVDPQSRWPRFDPKGTVHGARTAQVSSVSANRNSLAVKGLAASYQIAAGDKFQIIWSTNPLRTYYGEFSETVLGNSSGVTAQIEVFPHLPTSIVADMTIIIVQPACRVVIKPDSFDPGEAQTLAVSGMGFQVIEKK